ncbi:hypothetical protein BDA96_03G285000 [Sorghum bicolor]|uniref:Wall-associated receptor kinase galacturonan-binding domain-containing protein n=1 Tax=Sorghum bicolor TaxID=4558 RepID=A0A921RG03_SORBI|nr:hypothetical protein BDA96_03G285000 [Sorghum bicolor]
MALSSLRRHRLPLPLLLAVLFAASRGDDHSPSICKLQPYACGKVNISYPFYLSDETADVLGNSNSSCGYPGLAIDCVDDKYPTMQLGSSSSDTGYYSYNVTGINYNYSSFTISLVDPDVLDDQSSCPWVDHNVTVSPTLWLTSEYTVGYLLFFANCSVATVPGQPTIQPIACASDGGVDDYSFVIPSEVSYQTLSQDCKQVTQVPVLQNASLQMNSQWSTNGYSNVLKQGFQLELNLSRRSEECTKCELSNGGCAHSDGGEFVACLCTNGRVNGEECTNGKPYVSCTIVLPFSLFLLPHRYGDPLARGFMTAGYSRYPKL